jgi:hypothetical protein
LDWTVADYTPGDDRPATLIALSKESAQHDLREKNPTNLTQRPRAERMVRQSIRHDKCLQRALQASYWSRSAARQLAEPAFALKPIHWQTLWLLFTRRTNPCKPLSEC